MKPCPFCGSTDLHIRWANPDYNESGIAVVCRSCHIIGPEVAGHEQKYDTHHLAIEAWNCRTSFVIEPVPEGAKAIDPLPAYVGCFVNQPLAAALLSAVERMGVAGVVERLTAFATTRTARCPSTIGLLKHQCDREAGHDGQHVHQRGPDAIAVWDEP